MRCRIAAIQHDIAWHDPAATLSRVAPLVSRAIDGGALLIALPEMFATGYSMDPAVAQPPDGSIVRFLSDTAVEAGVWLTGGAAIVEEGMGKPVNRCFLASPDGSVLHHDKRHLFSFANEGEHYSAGDETTTWRIDALGVSPAVCYDLRFPEDFGKVASHTHLFVVIANWPSRRSMHWDVLLRARAIENQAYVLGVNRVGNGGGLSYEGGSVCCSPQGEVIAEAAGAEQVLFAEIDTDYCDETRERYPFLRDRLAGFDATT